MTKIDEIPLARELDAKMFENVIRDDPPREALTPPAAEAGSNYERLEILGNDRPAFFPFNQSELFRQVMLSRSIWSPVTPSCTTSVLRVVYMATEETLSTTRRCANTR